MPTTPDTSRLTGSETGLPPVQRPRRERVSRRKRKRAGDLAQALLLLQARYHEREFVEILERAAKAASQLAQASRRSDRDLVLIALESWEHLTVAEITEDTGLSIWIVNAILQELITLNLIKSSTQHNPTASIEGGPPQMLYSLIHTPIGSSFTLPGAQASELGDAE